MTTYMIGEFRFTVGKPKAIAEASKLTYGGRTVMHTKFRVNVDVESPRDTQSYGDMYRCDYTGSAFDAERNKYPNHYEVVRRVAEDIMEAYTDPVEFMSLCFAEPPEDTDYVKLIHDLIVFAEHHGEELEAVLPEEWWDEDIEYPIVRVKDNEGVRE